MLLSSKHMENKATINQMMMGLFLLIWTQLSDVSPKLIADKLEWWVCWPFWILGGKKEKEKSGDSWNTKDTLLP